MNPPLEIALRAAAAAQFAVAAINLFLVPLLGCKADLARLPLLPRQVFHVHSWFISATVAIFAVMTWRFADEMAAGTGGVLRWLAAAIGSFWTLRVLLQLGYYSASHWRGNAGRTAIHVLVLLLFGSCAAVYWLAVA